VGATFATEAAALLTPVKPSLSVTVSVTVYEPSCAYVCVTDAPFPVLPSPKFHA
jgi:hypothetical protein